MSDFIIFTRADGYRFSVERGDVYEVGDCNNGECIIGRRSKGCDIVKGSLEEVLAMLEQPKAQTAEVNHNKTALENTDKLPSRTPRLVEAVDMVDACDQIISDTDLALRSMSVVDIFTILHGIDARANRMRLALAAEKGRQELRDAVIDAARVQQLEPEVMDAPCSCRTCAAIDALDAYEKGEAQ